MKTWQPHPSAHERRSELIQVQLRSAPKIPSSPVDPVPEVQAPTRVQAQPLLEKKPDADYMLAEIPPPSDKPVSEDQTASDTSPGQALSTQQLRLQAGQLAKLLPPAQSSPGSGMAKPKTPPANWNQRAGAPFLSSFDDRSHEVTLPAAATVVDRWQAADGSHQVIVQMPNGDSLCGRAAAYNPMQPLVEQVMMFQLCGSKPTFTMPDRYRKES